MSNLPPIPFLTLEPEHPDVVVPAGWLEQSTIKFAEPTEAAWNKALEAADQAWQEREKTTTVATEKKVESEQAELIKSLQNQLYWANFKIAALEQRVDQFDSFRVVNYVSDKEVIVNVRYTIHERETWDNEKVTANLDRIEKAD